ncbi:MAG TPA: NAD-dependent malic enzyme [Candidatus Limnocylindrales bacterium]|nr:NAD-dependent malic enzyme [Candidatus Limnocylindrales bacterium]
MRRYRVTGSGIETSLRGHAVLHEPFINKGTAFSLEERAALRLTGLLPPAIKTLDQQAGRAYQQFRRQPDDLARNVYLHALHDRNEVLFYRIVTEHLHEMLPIVYTPTVALAIEQFSHQYRRPRGIFLSIDHPEQVEESLRNFDAGPDDIDLIVATDGERILGIGDWGAGGIDIAIGKLAIYSAAGGIDPTRVIPVVLDVGTDREELIDDPQYLGNPHPRVRGERYDAFIEQYVRCASRLFPRALLHWEDFGAGNARRILEHYRDQVCTFNDDMQGTGATVLAAVTSAMRVLGQSLREQRVVMFGAGTAGIGIADQLRDAMVREGLPVGEATRRFWCLGRHGLLLDDQPGLRDFSRPYARPAREAASYARDGGGAISLLEVVTQVRPTLLIGTSTTANAFSEPAIREMARQAQRPIIFPLSNPTQCSEATPAQLYAWTGGRALVATGSPFDPVSQDGVTHQVAQANNALLFPGIGLGTIVARARQVSDGMLAAAAGAVAAMADPMPMGAPLLPGVEQLRAVSLAVATAVAARAKEEGLARVPLRDVDAEVRAAMWMPVYRPVRAV